jgi:hypothetical protein
MVLDSWKILRRGREDEPQRGREDNPRRGREGKSRRGRVGWCSRFRITLGGKNFEISRQNHPRRLGCPRQYGAFNAPILLLEIVPRVSLGFVVRAGKFLKIPARIVRDAWVVRGSSEHLMRRFCFSR